MKRTVKTKSTKKEMDTCPFCKILPVLVEFRGGKKYLYYYVCENEKCHVNPHTPLLETKAQAKKAWNSRRKK